MTEAMENLEVQQPIEGIDVQAVDNAPQIPEAEKEARMLGWKPQEEYGGKATWKPAEDYVAEKKTTLTTEVRALRDSNSRMTKSVEALLAHQARKEEVDRQAGYEQAMREINHRMTEATKAGNIAAVNELATARENLVRVDEGQRIQHQNMVAQEIPEVTSWKTQNDWFGKDDDLTRYAKAYELELTHQKIPLQQRLQMTADKVKQAFPYKFEQQRRTQSTTMATGNKTVSGSAKITAGTYEALTPQARKECDAAYAAMGGKFKKEAFQANYVRYAKPEMFQG